MTARIAILADTHLPDTAGSAQDAALDWALDQLRHDAPDVVLVAGDVTGTGRSETARRARGKMDRSGLPYRMTPGNSDRRTPTDWALTEARLTVARPYVTSDLAVLVLDTSDETVPELEREATQRLLRVAGNRAVVLVTHHPPQRLEPESRAWLESLLGSGAIGLFVAGHIHRDTKATSGNCQVHAVRGLDPDKAIGGAPAVALFTLREGLWTKEDLPFPDGDVGGWAPDACNEFVRQLGISCGEDTMGGLAQARRYEVPCIEVRASETIALPRAPLGDAVAKWREDGGRYLSIHMPNLAWDTTTRDVEGLRAWRAAIDLSLALGADALTVHAPRVRVGHMQIGGQVWDALGHGYAESLGPAMDRGVVVSIENLHMRHGEPTDGSRGFGYLPDECLSWIRALRELTGYQRIGLHLDIGHARNNPPFSKRLSLGEWYALTGAEVTGYHLHQVRVIDGEMRNHHPFDGVFGPLISLSSFFWAWRSGQLCHAPVLLEIRDPAGRWPSLQHLRQHVATGAAP